MPIEIEGSREYRGASFVDVDLAEARFHNCSMRGAVITETTLQGARIEADVTGVTMNGFRIDELIEAEMLKRHPERARLKPDTPDGFRDALAYVGELRAATLEAVRGLSEDDLQRSTDDGNWSIVDNLRHLIFAEDAWVRRNAFGEEKPYHAMGKIPSFIDPEGARQAGIRVDDEFSFAETLPALHERHRGVVAYFKALTDEKLTEPCDAKYYDGTVAGALRVYLDHEWHHHQVIRRIATALK